MFLSDLNVFQWRCTGTKHWRHKFEIYTANEPNINGPFSFFFCVTSNRLFSWIQHATTEVKKHWHHRLRVCSKCQTMSNFDGWCSRICVYVVTDIRVSLYCMIWSTHVLCTASIVACDGNCLCVVRVRMCLLIKGTITIKRTELFLCGARAHNFLVTLYRKNGVAQFYQIMSVSFSANKNIEHSLSTGHMECAAPWFCLFLTIS